VWRYIITDKNGNSKGISNLFLYKDCNPPIFNRNKESPGNTNSQCTQNELTDEKVGVPTKEFFEKRQQLLLDLFTSALDL